MKSLSKKMQMIQNYHKSANWTLDRKTNFFSFISDIFFYMYCNSFLDRNMIDSLRTFEYNIKIGSTSIQILKIVIRTALTL